MAETTRDFFVCFTPRDRFQVGHRYQNTPPTEPVAWCETMVQAHEIAAKFNAILASNDPAPLAVKYEGGNLRVRSETRKGQSTLGALNDYDFNSEIGWLVLAKLDGYVLEIQTMSGEWTHETAARFYADYTDRKALKAKADKILAEVIVRERITAAMESADG